MNKSGVEKRGRATDRSYRGGGENVKAVLKLGDEAKKHYQSLCGSCHITKSRVSGDFKNVKLREFQDPMAIGEPFTDFQPNQLDLFK